MLRYYLIFSDFGLFYAFYFLSVFQFWFAFYPKIKKPFFLNGKNNYYFAFVKHIIVNYEQMLIIWKIVTIFKKWKSTNKKKCLPRLVYSRIGWAPSLRVNRFQTVQSISQGLSLGLFQLPDDFFELERSRMMRMEST